MEAWRIHLVTSLPDGGTVNPYTYDGHVIMFNDEPVAAVYQVETVGMLTRMLNDAYRTEEDRAATERDFLAEHPTEPDQLPEWPTPFGEILQAVDNALRRGWAFGKISDHTPSVGISRNPEPDELENPQ
jgi:hypothetical protein